MRLGSPHLGRKTRHVDLMIAENRAPFHEVFQFADVSREGVGHEQLQGGRRDKLTVLGRREILPEEMVHQEGNILAPLPERRHLELNDVEPVKEIFPERVFPDLLFEVAVRGGDDPDVGLLVGDPPDPPEFLFLQDAQQLSLELERHLADFVKKEGPTFRLFEETGPVDNGPGEGALLVAEELALHERLGDRAAVHRHKRLVLPRAVVVDGPGDEFLASAAFPEDQDVGHAGGDLFDEPVEVAHLLALADETAEAEPLLHLLAQPLVFTLEIALLQGVADQNLDFLDLERLGNVVVGT